jgi:hypothetical protein
MSNQNALWYLDFSRIKRIAINGRRSGGGSQKQAGLYSNGNFVVHLKKKYKRIENLFQKVFVRLKC